MTNKKGTDISFPSLFDKMDVCGVLKSLFGVLVMDEEWIDEIEWFGMLSCDSVSSLYVEID